MSRSQWLKLGALSALGLVAGCGQRPQSEGSVGSTSSALTLTLSSTTSNAIASSPMVTVTVSGGSGTYTCAITANTSGGTSCSVAGSVVSYTPGATAGYNLRANRTSNWVSLVAGGGGPYLQTGVATAQASELFILGTSGTGFTFKAKSSGNYVRNGGTVSAGNDLVADVPALASASVYAIQDCNPAGTYNRWGFKSAAGTNPYWQAKAPTIDAVNNGAGGACVASNAGAWEAFYLDSGVDKLTVTDTLGNTNVVTVTIEPPVAFAPATYAGSASTALSGVRAWGGSGQYTACSVTTNASGGGACTVSGTGAVAYTPGAAGGTDVLRVTDSQGHTGNLSVVVAAPYTLSASTSSAVASTAMTAVTVSGGAGPYSCAITSNTSGGASCSVGAGGVVSYTAGASAGYYVKSQRTNDFFQLVSAAGGPYVQTGGALGSSAELLLMSASITGFTLRAKSSSNYLRNAGTISTGNNLVADVAALASAGLFTVQDCNGAGNPGSYNRFGFKSATGSSPYWQAKAPTIDAVANGNGTACNAASNSAWEAFYLNPNTDTLTVSDSAGHTGTVTVTIENPLAIWPTSSTIAVSTGISSLVHAWGGSGVFTGGASACSVITNQSGGGACVLSGSGFFTYTAGATPGTDVIRVTDSEGHTATHTVRVASSITSISLTTSQAVTQVSPKSNTGFTVTGSSGVFTWTLVNNNSGATLDSVTGAYTAGSTPNVSDLIRVVDGSGNVGFVVVNVGPGIVVSPGQPAVQSGGSQTLTAQGGTGTGYTWAFISNASGGSLNAATGAYTGGATPGTDSIGVSDSVGNTASVSVIVSCGADSSQRILYPYSGTVFPLGMLPPLVMWSDNGTATYAKISLRYPATGTAFFSWSQIVPENGALTTPYNKLPTSLPITGGGRAQIPELVWRTFSNAAAGQDALISVQVLENNKGTIASSIKVHFASAALKGTIYYQTYDSSLVANAAPNGATMAIKVGEAVPTVADGNTACRDCHSISADGSRLITQDGNSGPALYQSTVSVNLATKAETTMGGANDGRFAWPALSPDGSMLFTNAGNSPTSLSGQWGGSVSTTPSSLYSAATGAALTTAGLPAGLLAMYPAFATDTSAVAFQYNNYDARTLSMMSVTYNAPTAGAWNFGTPKPLFVPPSPPASATYPSGSGAAVWPSFMPAGQNGLVVQNQVRFNCQETGGDGNSSINSNTLQHNIGAQGELWWVNTTGNPVPARLNRANGFGYLPQGKNGHGIAGTTIPTLSVDPTDTAGGTPSAAQLAAVTSSTCRIDLRNAIGAGDDSKLNFKPTVNPQTTGGYQWVVFTSRRLYGNAITINPYASDPRYTDEVSPSKAAAAGYALQPSPKKLWVAAMNTNPTPGSDPSYPAFYLDGQELYAGNSRSFWVLPQCAAPSTTPSTANLCTSTSDCCQTTPSVCALDIPIATNPPTAHCVPTTSVMCAADGAACNVDGDCCNVVSNGTRCSANKCTVPGGSGYPSAQNVTYDFQATCTAEGTHPVWQLLRSQVVIDGDSTIAFSAQSAKTQAGLMTAGAGAMGIATVTVQPPQYLTGAQTVDQVLRALSPMQKSGAWLRVTATLNPSSDHTRSPQLTALMPTYDCLFDE